MNCTTIFRKFVIYITLYKYYQCVMLIIYYNICFVINLNYFMVNFIMKLYFEFYYTMIDNMFFVIKIMRFGTPLENCKNKHII